MGRRIIRTKHGTENYPDQNVGLRIIRTKYGTEIFPDQVMGFSSSCSFFSLLYTGFFFCGRPSRLRCRVFFFAAKQASHVPCRVNEACDVELESRLRARVVILAKVVVAYEANTPLTLFDGKNHP